MQLLLLVTVWIVLGTSGITASPATPKCILKTIGAPANSQQDKEQVICVATDDEGNSNNGATETVGDSSNTWPRHFKMSTVDTSDGHQKRSINPSDYTRDSRSVGHNFMRFGRDIGHNFMRFGRAPGAPDTPDNEDTSVTPEDEDTPDDLLADQWLSGSGDDDEVAPEEMPFDRIIKDTDYNNNKHSFMRFGRANGHNFMRFGRADGHNFMRFGKGEGHKFLRFGRPEGHNFLRFGRAGTGHNFLRFGRANGHNFMRFGRHDESLAQNDGNANVMSPPSDNSVSESAAIAPVNAIDNKQKRSGHIFMRFGRK